MDRRRFLLSAGGGLAVSLVSTDAQARSVELPGGRRDLGLQRKAQHLRHRRDRVERRTLQRLGLEHPDPAQAAYARAAGAMAAIEGLSLVPVRDQVHPSIQALTAELTQQVGAGLHALGHIFEAVAAGGQELASSALSELFARTELALGSEEELSEHTRRLHRNGLADLHAQVREEGLSARLRREARRLRRLADLSQRIAEAGTATALLTPSDPHIIAQVEDGQERWQALESEPSGGYNAVQVLGLIGCGLGILVGGFSVVLGIACAVSCDAPGALSIALLGALIIGGCVAGIVAIHAAKRRRQQEQLGPDEGGTAPETG